MTKHEDVGFGAADLQADAAPHPNRRGSTPPSRGLITADSESASVLAADEEAAFLRAGGNDGALSAFEELLWDALISGVH